MVATYKYWCSSKSYIVNIFRDKGHINFNHGGYVMPPQPSMFSSPHMYHSSQPNMNLQNQPDAYVPQAILQGQHGVNTHGSDDTRILQNSNLQGEFLPTGAYGRQMNVASGKFSWKFKQVNW